MHPVRVLFPCLIALAWPAESLAAGWSFALTGQGERRACVLRHDGLNAPTLTLLQTAGEPVLVMLSEDGLPARFQANWTAGGPRRALNFIYDERKHFQYVADELDRAALGELSTGDRLRLSTQVLGDIEYDLSTAATSVAAFLQCLRGIPDAPAGSDPDLAEDLDPEEPIAEAEAPIVDDPAPADELSEDLAPEEEPQEEVVEDVSPDDVTIEDVGPQEGTAAAAVRGFYSALERGDGREAASFVVSEKRGRGPYSAEGMTRFYGNLTQSLELLSVRALDERRFLARYTFEAGNSVCDGRARVTTVERGGRHFIQSINALSGC